jgi:hypothetical protein
MLILWLGLWMLVFDYMIRSYNQDVSIGASPAAEWRGSVGVGSVGGDTAGVGSTGVGSVGGHTVGVGSAGRDSTGVGTGWITVRNYLSSMNDKVTDVVVDRRNECWWGQWRRLTLGHESEYKIVKGLWPSCLAKGVANLVGIRWVD